MPIRRARSPALWSACSNPMTADSSVERETLPPTGTVTLLFTDIEGSTRLWETQ
jgi:class 3 adenylate cyclase